MAAFLLHLSRLNVAITRARCLAAVLGSPAQAIPVIAATMDEGAAVRLFARVVVQTAPRGKGRFVVEDGGTCCG